MRLGKVTKEIVLVAALFATAAAADDDQSTAQHAKRREALSRVVVADGVSREEAEAIASFYFYDHIRIGCGAVGDAEGDGVSWRFPARVGFAGARNGEVVVDKTSGSVKWDDHPAVQDPLSMLAPVMAPSNPPLQRPAVEGKRTPRQGMSREWFGGLRSPRGVLVLPASGST